MSTRTEHDSFGPIEVPAARLWGAQTQRSLRHFAVSTETMPVALIHALVRVKRAAASVNRDLGELDARKGDAIVAAADEVLGGRWPDEFPLSVWQTGSGTQTNMNVNEVLANRASELLGGARGGGRRVHPNDDVNRGQSSNDVFPTAMHVAAALEIDQALKPALLSLRGTLEAKAQAYGGHRCDRARAAPAGDRRHRGGHRPERAPAVRRARGSTARPGHRPALHLRTEQVRRACRA